ncbi:MAG: DNA-processing protein DprA [Alphaproteobacteria bacterium]|nr:DNA-processing protein DprA [Alphaproteobacteria bacterium]
MMITTRAMNDNERMDWLRLIRSENIGPITFYKLLERFGTAENALRQAPELAKRAGAKKPIIIATREVAEKEISALEKCGGYMVAACEADYPAHLRAVEDAPPILSVKGQRSALNGRRMVAMVGSRNASLNGRQFAERIARDCGQADMMVVSGLARGIDTAAHQGALKTGTIAVVAGGIDVIYPEENAKLYDAICEKGAIIAESQFGVPPTNRHFPKRNRIISGVSEGVLVIEAVEHSGSLITARMALEQGREVMAVPGSPLDPRSKGNNNLLRQGAILVENVQDIMGGLSKLPNHTLSEPLASFSERNESLSEDDIAQARSKILETLGPVQVRIDDLIRDVNLPASIVLAALLELELAGKAARSPGQFVALIDAS